MIYTVRDEDGKLRGVSYPLISRAIIAHHAQFGETLEPVDRVENHGTDDFPVWKSYPVDPQELRASMSASRFQLRRALQGRGRLNDADAALNVGEDQDTVEAWLHGQQFNRLSPTVVSLGAALGLSDDDMDDVFAEAREIQA
jgi:hypothetical protein